MPGSRENGLQDSVHTIDGVDPDESLSYRKEQERGQEMQERGGMPMLSGRRQSVVDSRGGNESAVIDSMDLDSVIEDEHTAEQSAAVRNLL